MATAAQAKNKASALALARAKLAARRAQLARPNPTDACKAAKPAKARKAKSAKPAKASKIAKAKAAKPTVRKAPAARPLSVHEILAHNAGALRPNPVHRPGPQPAIISTRHTPSRWIEPQENPMASLTPEQKRTIAEGRAMFAAMKTGGAASKPASPAKKKSSKKPVAKKSSKKPVAKKSSRKPASRPASPTIIAVPMPAAAAKKPRKKARRKSPNQVAIARQYVVKAEKVLAQKPKKRVKKAAVKKGKLPKTIKSGTYQSKRHGAITIRRTYPSANPVVEFKQIAFAGGGLLLGIAAADLLDRYVATRVPDVANAKDPLFGAPAAVAVQKKADGYRMLASGGGTLAFGLGAYLLRDKAPNAAYGLGGIGAGFGVKFLGQLVSDVIMPLIFKADPALTGDAAKTLGNRLYFDKYEPETPAEQTATRLAWSGYYRGLPGQVGRPAYPQGYGQTGYPARFPFVQAPARSVGPVATGAVGCGCSSSSALRGAYGWDLSKVFPTPSCKSSFGEMPNGKCQMCSGEPQPVQPPVAPDGTTQPTQPGDGSTPGTDTGRLTLVATPNGPAMAFQPVNGGQQQPTLVVESPYGIINPLTGRDERAAAAAAAAGNVAAPMDAPAEQPAETASVIGIGDLVRMNSRKSRRR